MTNSKLKTALAAADRESSAPMLRLRSLESRVAKLAAELQFEQSRRRHAEHELEQVQRRAAFEQSLGTPNQFEWPPRPRRVHGKATAIVVMTDWHVEERVDARCVNGLNEFNLKVASKRIRQCVSKACELIEAERSMSNIQDLVVAILGDLITGYIHDDLRESNYLSPTEACLFVQDHLCSSLDYLRRHSGCKAATVVTCYGNHGRTTPKMRVTTAARNSFEWMLYHQIAKTYQCSAVRWQIGDGYHNWLNVQGKLVRFHHGDAIRYQGGVGGITIPVLKAIAAWDRAQPADLDVFGHWHQFCVHRKFVASNCLCGYGPHALSIKAEFSQPSQTLIILDRDRPVPVSVKEIFV